MFKEVVEKKIKDPVGRLTRLIKFTDDETKDLVKHCIHLTPDTGYDTAITLLNKRCGSPHSLLASYWKEIKSLAPVKPGDALGFRKFHNFVLKCVTLTPKVELELTGRARNFMCSCDKTTRWFKG